MTIHVIVGLMKKILLYKISYFPEPILSKNEIKFELNFSNYATKSDLKRTAGVGTSKCAKNINLASLKSEADKLDIDKLEKVLSGFNSLKSKIDKLDVDKLKPVPTDLKN